MVRIKVRVFTFSIDPTAEHSYMVGSAPGGLSSAIGMVVLDDDDDDLTFESVRPRIELKDEYGLIRRNLMFQEALFQMTAARNPHQWPLHTLQTYWLGYYAHEDDIVPTIIPVRPLTRSISSSCDQTDQETRSLRDVLDMKSTAVTADLILIPQSQIGPVCNQCCQGCSLCPRVHSGPPSDNLSTPAKI
ncbi:Aste57867_9312 [Aphanomyces stellatus]|uniref:Aste57867_9312 protein n=1 Tax=Aphanomyces stellatus TaxID=120398 RepID=A0A485KN02_9STRA|nr:hypothetical protein As57867_009276 [Aphanomyces stellatus]VFT86194.1 Aste57867_9312 [Aphanomyces stellatus]